MTEQHPQQSVRKRAALVMMALFTAGVFLFPISDVVGYLALALAPVAATVEVLGYPVALTRLAERVQEQA